MKNGNGIKIAYSKLILEVFNRTMENLLPVLNEDIEIIDKAISTLPDNEQRILKLKFGLESGTGLTLKEIGIELGKTPERIRQIKKHALRKLRHHNKIGKSIFFYTSLRQSVETLIKENQELRERIEKCEFFINQQEKDLFLPGLNKEQAIKANPMLDKLISESEFSIRTRNALMSSGAITINDIVVKTEKEWLMKKHFGKKILAEMKEILSELGLNMGMQF